MRMLTFLAIGLISGAAWATCKPDIGGTFKIDHSELLEPIDVVHCFWCREVLHHPKDFRNFMWNWAALGRATTSHPVTQDLGREIFDNWLDVEITVRNVAEETGTDTMAIPVCNDHGQCATGTIRVEHNYERYQFAMGWHLYFNSSIKAIHVTVTLGNGDTISATYSPAQLSSHRALSGYKLPVPYNRTEDFAEDGDCLNNLGQIRPPDSELDPPQSGGGGNPDEDPYAHWWDEEEAYGGRIPSFRCGTATLSTGESTRTCGWFWF